MDGFPKFELTTPFGSVEVTLNDARNAYVDANSKGRDLEYRGRRYKMTFHLEFDGLRFEPKRDDRGNTHGSVYGEVPPSFKTKITEGVLTALNAHLNANPMLLTEAQIVSENNDLFRLEEKLAKIEAERTELLASRGSHIRALSRLAIIKARGPR